MSKGFTLIEILVAIAIISVVSLLIGLFTLDVSDFGIFLGDALTAQQELQQTLNTLMIEVRSIGPGDDGSYPIAAVSSTSFTFFSDIDSDNSFERVRYFFDSSQFKKGVVRASGNPATYVPSTEIVYTLVHDVIASATANIFSFYDTNYYGSQPALAFPFPVSEIRMMKAYIVVDRTPENIQSRIVYSVTAKLRNMND